MSTTPRRLDKYELLERLGYGGIAEVWKALDTQLQRNVAIKVLRPDLRDDPNFVTRFQHEAQLIASLRHHNIVQIHDFQIFQPEGTEKDTTAPIAYMVMDYVEGSTLADYIHKTSNAGIIPDPQTLLNLFTSISLAVDFAHRRGMIHRDIKPANILLDMRNTLRNSMGEPILTDFGVAKLLNTANSTVVSTQIGTPLYIAPEQARGYPGNERSDLYSLGVILYEMVTGTMPFRGETTDDVVAQHINAQPTRPERINPQVPPALSEVIMRSLSKDPSARYSSAAAMTIALAESLQLSILEALGEPAYPLDSDSLPTYPSPGSATLQANWQNTGGQPSSSSAFTPMLVYSQPQISPPISSPAPVPPTPQPPMPTPPGRRLWFILIPTLVVLLIGVSIAGAIYFPLIPFPRSQGSVPVGVTQGPIVGQAFYTSSGQFNPSTAQGIADQLQMNLQNVSAPQPGKSYYVWLLGDKNPDTGQDQLGKRPITPPLLLTNNLLVQNGVVHFTFPGDAQHNNLISNTSRLLITEENSNQRPNAPSQDRSTWRYYGEIPQLQIPGDPKGFSALTHIRHLFYNETDINILGLYGGLDTWMFRNTEKLLEWSTSARDDWHGANTTGSEANLMQAQFIRILDYLDGTLNVHVDLPANTPLVADALASKVPLLTVDPQNQVQANFATNPFGYTDHVQFHVGQVTKATDATPEMRQRAARIIDAISRAKVWLSNVRKDAAELFQISNDPVRLGQANTGSILDDLVTQATFAYIGQLDPITNQVQAGVLQAHDEILQLATITIMSNVPQSL